MSFRTWRAALLALAALMISSGLVQAQPIMIPASEAVGPPPSVDGTGLAGSWYFSPDDPTREYVNIAGAQIFIASEQPYATFTASLLFWNAVDTTPADQFLD